MYEDEAWKPSAPAPTPQQSGVHALSDGEMESTAAEVELMLSHLAFDSYRGFARCQRIESRIRRSVALVVGLATVLSLFLTQPPEFKFVVAEVLSVVALYFGAESYLARGRTLRLNRTERELLALVERNTRQS